MYTNRVQKRKTMKMRTKQWGGIVALVLLLAGCVSTAHVEKDDATDFTRFKTFAWIEREDRNPAHQVNNLVEQKVRAAVSRELSKSAGWKESTSNPDILLTYDVLVERSVRERTDPVYSRPFFRTFYNPYARRLVNVYYPAMFMGYDNYEVPVREGTITVSMTDVKTDRMVWQGWSTDQLSGRNLTAKEIQNNVKAIFRKFDIAKN